MKRSIFSATSGSSAALSHVLRPLQACHAVAIDFVLDFLQYLPSRACKCQNDVSHCSSSIFSQIPDVVLASLVPKLYLVFADSGIFVAGLSLLVSCLLYLSELSLHSKFHFGQSGFLFLASSSWVIPKSSNSISLSLPPPLRYSISLTLIPVCVFSYQLITEYFHLFFSVLVQYSTPAHLIDCLPCLG